MGFVSLKSEEERAELLVQSVVTHNTRSRVASVNIPVVRSLPLRGRIVDPLGPTSSAKRVEEDPVLRQRNLQ